MHEIRADAQANVQSVLVDEGQLVAEGDEVAVLESVGQVIVVTTDVPGVVRELHVEPGDSVQGGALIALIDGS